MKRILTCILSIFCIGALLAAPVDSVQIVRFVDGFVTYQYAGLDTRITNSIKSLEMNGEKLNLAIVSLYPVGWVLVSTDDVAQPVYGFNFNDKFNFDNFRVNTGLQFMTNSFDKEIRQLILHSALADTRWTEPVMRTRSASITNSVEPLIAINWNQGKNWNVFCPANDTGPGGHVYVGCVAVAMAQAMTVYEHPKKGTGIASYYANGYGTLTVNFDTYGNYNWSNMRGSTPNDDIAAFLYHCAVSVRMNFSPNGSGAYTRQTTSALKNYFGYSSSVTYNERTGTDAEWMSLLNTELDNGRPIIYSGDADNGSAGHAFNIDGYIPSGDTYMYHLNWGWGGSNNGNYSINVLTPGKYDFTKNHEAVIGIKPISPGPTDINLSNSSIMEGLPAGTTVGNINVSDEWTGNAYTYTLSGTMNIFDEENPLYFLEEGGILKTTKVFDYISGRQNKEGVVIRVSDSYDNKLSKTFIINILEDTGSDLTGTESNILTDVLYDANENCLSWTAQPSWKQVRIFSLEGNLMLEKTTYDNSMILNGFTQGIYIAEIKGPNSLSRMKFMVR